MTRTHYAAAGKIAAIYAITAAIWIMFSDKLLLYIAHDPATLTGLQTAKGWFFVLATAALLFWLVVANLKQLETSRRKLIVSNEELTAANEELTANDEELRQQFDELMENQGRISRQNECLLTLRETAFALMHQQEVDGLLTVIAEKAAAIGGSQHSYLYTLTDDGREMELKARGGAAIQEIGYRQQWGEGIVGAIWETGKPLIIQNYQQWANKMADPRFSAIHTSVAFPLMAGSGIVGAFGFNYFEHHELDQVDMDLLGSFAELASIALDNARLHRSLQQELAERREAEAELRVNQARTQAILTAMPDSLFRWNRDGILIDYQLGTDMEIVTNFADGIGKHMAAFSPAALVEKAMPAIEQAILTRKTQQIEYELDTRQGGKLYREARYMACSDTEVIAIVRDITRRREMEQELKRLSFVDQMTGLHNRPYFENVLRRMSDSRYLPVGVIVCDIDGLKLINDTLGHTAGDGLIMATASIISSCFSDGDILARVGGGEFGIIMPNSDAAMVAQAVRAIRESTEQYRALTEMPLSISIGMCIRTARDENMNDISKEAERNMHRAKLHSNQSSHSAIVDTLARALEARDFVTDGHADRLQSLMQQLALAAGLPDSALPDLRLLGRFHDIGKVGIPDSILFKPGRLTADEYETMKSHCEIGYRIAQASPELAPIADWILKHQEWWNGQGYPLGLAAEDIPLPCRMLAIVDAFDAMTNDRPYRDAMTPGAAKAELVACAGRQFDPQLVELFVKLIEP